MFGVVVSTLAIVAMWLAALFAALSAARNARTAQGAIAWVVFLLSAPMIALPSYLIFGGFRFKGYHRPRVDLLSQVDLGFAPEKKCAASDLVLNLAPFETVAGLPVTQGNSCHLLINGERTFDAIMKAIDQATAYILVQFYILRDDRVGQRLQRHLIAAAERGIPVWLMIDAIGSHGLPASYLAKLEKAGVNLVDPASSTGPKRRFHLNFRNHRKTVVVDGRIGFTGGLNIGDEYLGRDPDWGPWRDTHLQLQGPAVQQLQLSFVEDWQWQTIESIWELMNWAPEPLTENKSVLIAATGPPDQMADGSMLYFSVISACSNRLWITSPYFVPNQEIAAALSHAALRGVDVRILLPAGIDHYLPWLAAFSFLDDLRQAGVRFFRYQPGFMHQKLVLADDNLVGIGTMNLDNRSFRLNFETMALIFDQGMARDVQDMLEKDFEQSQEVTTLMQDRSWKIRLLSPMARLLAPVL